MRGMAHPVASGERKGGMRLANDHQESCKPSAKSIEMTAKSYGSAQEDFPCSPCRRKDRNDTQDGH